MLNNRISDSVIALCYMATFAAAELLSFTGFSAVTSDLVNRIVVAIILSMLITHFLAVAARRVDKMGAVKKPTNLRNSYHHTFERKHDILDYFIRRNTGINIALDLIRLTTRLSQKISGVERNPLEGKYRNEIVAITTMLLWNVLGSIFYLLYASRR